jgi:hypothetical protein
MHFRVKMPKLLIGYKQIPITLILQYLFLEVVGKVCTIILLCGKFTFSDPGGKPPFVIFYGQL